MNISLSDILNEVVNEILEDQKTLTEADENQKQESEKDDKNINPQPEEKKEDKSEILTSELRDDTKISLTKEQQIATDVAAKTAAETAKAMGDEGETVSSELPSPAQEQPQLPESDSNEVSPVSSSVVPIALSAGAGALALRKKLKELRNM